jgi:hypothetical protein
MGIGKVGGGSILPSPYKDPGFGVRVSMQSGHLEMEDGVGPERRTIRLARVGTLHEE